MRCGCSWTAASPAGSRTARSGWPHKRLCEQRDPAGAGQRQKRASRWGGYRAAVGTDDLPSLDDVSALEAAYTVEGRPALGPARAALVRRWAAGARDRETALRLAFLDWYSCSDPDFLSGLPDLTPDDSYFVAATEHLLAANTNDREVLFVLGLMLKLFPWCAGRTGEEDAESRGQSLLARFWASPDLPADVFANRGAYGKYFAHMRRAMKPPSPSPSLD